MDHKKCLYGANDNFDVTTLRLPSGQGLFLYFWLKEKCFFRSRSGMFRGAVHTSAGKVPRVDTRLGFRDYLGAVRVRWLIGRDHYTIEPGLYAVGNPGPDSEVFVTANYKLSFDHLRKNLEGIDGWILVLDTRGVNVWCAAGKGTFGTHELVEKIRSTRLEEIINHRRLIVPQLGATGISAYRVKELTTASDSHSPARPLPVSEFVTPDLKIRQGFKVLFGPVRAVDIKAYLQNGYRATEDMRRVNFTLGDRLRLIPVDLVYNRYRLLIALVIFLIPACLHQGQFSLNGLQTEGLRNSLNLVAAYLSGIVLTPLLLPLLPPRMFAMKGILTGGLTALVLLKSGTLGTDMMERMGWILMILAVSSFLAMNFTGASTYTSLTGVKKEMRLAVPVQIVFAAGGIVLTLIHLLNQWS